MSDDIQTYSQAPSIKGGAYVQLRSFLNYLRRMTNAWCCLGSYRIAKVAIDRRVVRGS